jgi:hypothetical protein
VKLADNFFVLFQEDCEWTIHTDTVFMSHEVKFKLNEPKEDITMDGRAVSFVVHQPKSNQWVEIQQSGGKTTTLTRDFEPDRMQVGLLINNIGAMSIFRRRPDKDMQYADFNLRKK